MNPMTLAAASLMLAGAAFAHNPGKPNRPSAENAAAGICTPAQLAVIDEAFAEAGPAIANAVAQLARNPELPELRIWFGSTPAKFVRRNLEAVGALVAQGRPAQTACNDMRHCGERTFGYAYPLTGAMGFCPGFFRAERRGLDSRLGVVVHEVSHIAVRTRDARYSPEGVRDLGKNEPATAAMNADSYEYFVESLAR